MEDKNFFVAIILCIGVYAVWFGLVTPRITPVPVPVHTQLPVSTSPGETTGSVPSGETPNQASETHVVPKKVPKPIELRTSDAEIQISSLGGGISSYRYHGPLGFIELVTQPFPGLFSTWPNVVFLPSKEDGNATAATLEARLPSGLIVQKAFQFGQAGTLGSLKLTIRNPNHNAATLASWGLGLGPGLGTVPSEEKDNAKLWRAIGLFPPPPNRTQDDLEHLKIGDHDGPWRWLAIDNRYFLTAAFASPEVFDRAHVDSSQVEQPPSQTSIFAKFFSQAPDNTKNYASAPQMNIWAKASSLAPGETRTIEIPFYIGPKSYAGLERLHLGLEKSVNFGWFNTLGRWMLDLLQTLHRLTGNYGWSIILLTIMLQAALFPLTSKSMKSMNKMRKLQPEIARIQQKFKEDPQRLNTEMMELYKAKGVNPMGGCLPMLAQMPIFVALFNALRNAWELHGSPWILWVHDLSAHDPFYILPILMGGVMFVQNRVNPAATADPSQAAMMKWTPIIFTFMFFKFPAGLVLYWLTNSLINALQQIFLFGTLNELRAKSLGTRPG